MIATIVEYFADHKDYRCGYCKSPNTNASHGMWAHTMTPEVYQGLIDRGWRRSGQYCYKPTNNTTCCPLYTIRCNALDFKISKSQKKVLKRMKGKIEKAPSDGKAKSDPLEGRETCETWNMDISTIEPPVVDSCQNVENAISFDMNDSDNKKMVTCVTPTTSKSPISKRSSLPSGDTNETMEEQADKSKKSLNQPCQKKRAYRLERRRLKLEKQGKSSEFENISTEKNLTDLISENDVEITLVSVGSEEFEKTFKEVHSLYMKYQMKIHGDEEDECTPKQFRRFLCTNPFVQSKGTPCGSFHQMYRKNKKLMAVGVIDILPKCVSGVYFFYDPDFSHLSLGTFGALNEIHFVRKLNEKFKNIQYYYMGFYIHSCQKMRYKGNYVPSFLLCPEVYEWRLLDDQVRKLLDEKPYSKFCEGESNKPQDVSEVMILKDRRTITYTAYNATDDKEEIAEYCNLVGSHNSKMMLLYRK